jgi:hypothetical protein
MKGMSRLQSPDMRLRHTVVTVDADVQQRAEHLDRSKFFGVPITSFENAGRQQFILLLMEWVDAHIEGD